MAITYKDSAQLTETDTVTCLVYGTWGSGKSRFAATFPSPFFIVTDNQTMALRGKSLPYAIPSSYSDILTIIGDAQLGREVFKGGKIRTIVLDGISEVSPMLTDELAGMKGDVPGKMDMPKWGAAVDRIRMMMRNLISLRSQYHIVVTAKSITEKDELSGEILGLPDTIGKMRNTIGGFFDMVLYADSELKYNEAAKAMTPSWRLWTVRKGYYPAIDRTGKLSPSEPNDFPSIMAKIRKDSGVAGTNTQ